MTCRNHKLIGVVVRWCPQEGSVLLHYSAATRALKHTIRQGSYSLYSTVKSPISSGCFLATGLHTNAHKDTEGRLFLRQACKGS